MLKPLVVLQFCAICYRVYELYTTVPALLISQLASIQRDN